MNTSSRIAMGPIMLVVGLILALAPSTAHASLPLGKLAGTWDVVLTLRSCATGDSGASFKELATFDLSGTGLSSTSFLAQATKTPGHGTWRQLSLSTYSYAFKFFRFDATGAFVGWSVVRQVATMNANGSQYTAEGGIETYNTAGALVGAGCSTTVATRFE